MNHTDNRGDTPRTIDFSSIQWLVKSGRDEGPGPNNWSDDERSVWVDSTGRLHPHDGFQGVSLADVAGEDNCPGWGKVI